MSAMEETKEHAPMEETNETPVEKRVALRRSGRARGVRTHDAETEDESKDDAKEGLDAPADRPRGPHDPPPGIPGVTEPCVVDLHKEEMKKKAAVPEERSLAWSTHREPRIRKLDTTRDLIRLAGAPQTGPELARAAAFVVVEQATLGWGRVPGCAEIND